MNNVPQNYIDFAKFELSPEKTRTLLSIDNNYNVTFPDDLTLDEAKELLRRMAVMTLKIQKALMEMSRPVEATE